MADRARFMSDCADVCLVEEGLDGTMAHGHVAHRRIRGRSLMTAHRFDVLGLGNAIVDVIAPVDDDFLIKAQLRKGAMQLVDETQAQSLYDAMGATTIVSGGSAANTIA